MTVTWVQVPQAARMGEAEACARFLGMPEEGRP